MSAITTALILLALSMLPALTYVFMGGLDE